MKLTVILPIKASEIYTVHLISCSENHRYVALMKEKIYYDKSEHEEVHLSQDFAFSLPHTRLSSA